MSKTSISTDQELRKGESIQSANKNYEAVFQEDNNFVIYKKGTGPVWATATNNKKGFRILLQQDGNLVMYSKEDKPCWNTGTYGHNSTRMRLTITNDGHLVLDNNGVNLWSSQNSKGIMC